ncbi:PspC domain-containing protein [Bizionia argentinensis JUB59]|uniref:PspC domain-containing protein n=1 Tax=Bizionia argentinensis JUB59 TaxID=1046627 RepID=G2EB60_9FLAO|nr:PspC domain-containing protein [Bizionia argentinensis]EGV44401.1 PspC domain-containing protein [Bizionia argentinensis JUB59]
MNKTVNINLAGIFFHIDEDAYLKLQRYLEAIKRSFTDSQGRSEIISDIEARIAELFSERIKHDKHVIGNKEVDEVITIMGQPEDYLVDDDIFEDEPKSQHQRKEGASKKLFRDTENSYIGGVSAGFAHYFGIDALWIRLLWILLIFGAGTGIFLYILLWILIPEAKTTADKLTMKGEPVNISNIEKKIKDGFDNVSGVAKNVGDSLSGTAKSVSDSVSGAAKNVNFQKHGNSIKSSSQNFFDAIGEIFIFFFKIIAKFIGVILIITGASAIIGLLVGFLTVGLTDVISIPGFELINAANTSNTPIWLVSMLAFFAIGIPFFFIFYLGLKILINNLKSIGNIAKFTLLGIWLLSIISLTIIGIKQATQHAFDARVSQKETLNITANDTLIVKMVESLDHNRDFRRSSNSSRIAYNDTNEKYIYSRDIRLIVKSTKDSVGYIIIEKKADGSSFVLAKKRANSIDYDYQINGNTLLLDPFLTTDIKNKFSDQEVEITLYLPEGSTLYANDNTTSFHRNTSRYNDILDYGMEEHFLKIINDGVICADCPEDDFKVNVDINNNDAQVKLDSQGIQIKSNDSSLELNENGIKANSEEVKVNIDKNGIEIITNKK